MLSLEGKQLGNYDVIRRIRVGGMGAVYEGRQRTAFDRRVAIKVILGNYASDREMRRRFAREARTVARLHHPHILQLIEFGDEQGILYLVMPFIDGGTLTSYLRQSLPDLSEVAGIYQQLLDAVEYAHEAGLIHRDIKSSNVLLEMHRSGPPYIYLADFGLVRTSRQASQEQVGKLIPLDQVPGTPHYMAPEQTRGIVTPLTDIYAMGVLLYQLLTGELPYNDDDDVRVIQMHLQAPIPSPSDHDSSIPQELSEVVQKAMAKRPEARYQSIAELRRAFLAAIKGPIATVQENEPPVVSTYNPPPKRRISIPLTLPEARQVMRKKDWESVVPFIRSRAQPRVTEAMKQKARITETVKQKPRVTETVKLKPRVTEEPVKRRRLNKAALVAMIVPVLLIALLLVPRLLGANIFPVGFPLFGASPVATIDITPQTKVLQNDYILTASPLVSAPDLAGHTIPDRNLQATATGSRLVQTTGTKTIAGTQAQGSIVFTNSSADDILLPTQYTLVTVSGVHVQITQAVNVPKRSKGKNGTQTAPAQATDPGVNGNIAAYAINGPCCGNGGLTATNTTAFTGGVDAKTLRVVNQLDVDGVQSSLSSDLEQQAGQQLQKQVGINDIVVSQPNYTVAVSPGQPVGTQVDQVRIDVTVTGSQIVYNRNDANAIASQLLSQKATQTLDSHYRLQGDLTINAPHLSDQGKNGVVHLNVGVKGIWIYVLSLQQTGQWAQSIKGATSAAARAYLASQAGVASVDIQLPLGTDHLPSALSDIRIILIDD